jgi:hypothetical protein
MLGDGCSGVREVKKQSYLLIGRHPHLVRLFAGGSLTFWSSASGILSSYSYTVHRDGFQLPLRSGHCDGYDDSFSIARPFAITGSLISGTASSSGLSGDGVQFFVANRGPITGAIVTPARAAPVCLNNKGEVYRYPFEPYVWGGSPPPNASAPARCCPGPNYPNRYVPIGYPASGFALLGTEDVVGNSELGEVSVPGALAFKFSRRAFGRARTVRGRISQTYDVDVANGRLVTEIRYNTILRLEACARPTDRRSCRRSRPQT